MKIICSFVFLNRAQMRLKREINNKEKTQKLANVLRDKSAQSSKGEVRNEGEGMKTFSEAKI